MVSMVSANYHQNQFEQVSSRLINKLLFDLMPLGADEIEQIERDDDLYAVALHARSPAFLTHLCDLYDVKPDLLEQILEYDLPGWAVSIKNRRMVARVISLRERVAERLAVWQRNRHAFLRVLEHFDLPRDGFFDVGCALGLAMLAGAEAGFRRVEGVELKSGFVKFADGLRDVACDSFGSSFDYHVGDFNDLDLGDRRFDLVMCVDVLEHTPDLDATIRKMLEICSQQAVVYIYQGNGRSLPMVQNEPHYRLPALTILPQALAVEVLQGFGKVDAPEDYIVRQWPTLDYLEGQASRDFELQFVGGDTNLRNGIKYPVAADREKLQRNCEKMIHEKLYPSLATPLREEVKRHVDRYFREVEADAHEMDTTTFERVYLQSCWNLAYVRG